MTAFETQIPKVLNKLIDKEEEMYDPQEYPCHRENNEFSLPSSVKQRSYCGLNENGPRGSSV